MTDNFISLADEFSKIAGSANVLGDPNGEPAYLYARSSSKLQAVEGRESLSRQLLVAHEKAKIDARYIPLDMAYWDIWRGKDADRPEFLRLLSDLKHHTRSDLIYIDQTDRLSRNTAVYYVLLHDLTRFGLAARFESEEDDLVRHIKLAFDEIELEKWRYRQVNANRARATKGHVISKRPAFGYKLSEDGLMYVIEEEQAHWVSYIFEQYLAGRSMRSIAKSLTDAGLPTPLHGKKGWLSETIRKILQHEIYKGTYIANRYEQVRVWEGGKQKLSRRCKPESEWIYVTIPAIVSAQEWDEVQQRLSKNQRLSLRNGRKHEWLLTGIVRCVCGAIFTCKVNKNRRKLASGKNAVYTNDLYRCGDQNRARPPYTCSRGQIAKHRLDTFVLQALEMLIMNAELWEQTFEDNTDEVERLKQHEMVCRTQIKELDLQIEELLQLALEQRTSRTRQLFREKQVELEKRRSDYDEQLRITVERLELAERKSDRKEAVMSILNDLRQLGGLLTLPFEMKRRLVTQLVDEITLNTQEHWFEIRGVFSDKFFYGDDDQLMTTSDHRAWWPRRSARAAHRPWPASAR